jgi:hypothetical protein
MAAIRTEIKGGAGRASILCFMKSGLSTKLLAVQFRQSFNKLGQINSGRLEQLGFPAASVIQRSQAGGGGGTPFV